MASSVELPKAAAVASPSTPEGMEGCLGILYVCGEQTGGEISVADALLGRKVRGMCGAYDRFVALVDAWELEWPAVAGRRDREAAALECELVAQGLHDVKIHHVAIGENHRVALSLDGQLFSWGRRGSSLANGEMGHASGVFPSQDSRPSTPATPEADDAGKRRPPSATESVRSISNRPQSAAESIKSIGKARSDSATATATTTGVPHRVLTSPELFFTKVACGKHHSAAITDNGDIYTWGRNFEGQLGRVFASLPKELNAVLNGICAWPKYVAAFLGKPRAVSVCCGETFTVVLLADGCVYRLGDKSSAGASPRPTATSPTAGPAVNGSASTTMSANILNLMLESGSGGEPFVGIACGYAHVLAVTSAGEAFSWGLNTFGQLGHGRHYSPRIDSSRSSKTDNGGEGYGGSAVPMPVESDNGIKWAKVFAGGNYSAAISTDHQLYTWGNSNYGKLGHGKGLTVAGSAVSPTFANEFAPRRVETLARTVVSSVVCCARDLFAFAPTYVSSLSPLCGENTGGYELRLRGSGFWKSEDLTVRFVPLTEGRLMRGALGEFREDSGEIVCRVPKFRLPGEFAVEVSMNGKHFTSNGRIFTVYKRPQVAAVSACDARFDGGEEIALELIGCLPEICQRPIVRFVRCRMDTESGGVIAVDTGDQLAPAVIAAFDPLPESVAADGQQQLEEEASERDPMDLSDRLLRLCTPSITPVGDGILPYTLEISYDCGLFFSPVCVDPTLAKSYALKDGEDASLRGDGEPSHDRQQHRQRHQGHQNPPGPILPHVIWMHAARLVRVRPNVFLANALPQVIEVELHHLLAPGVVSLSVTLVHTQHSKANSVDGHEAATNMSAKLPISSVEGSIVTCTIPPLSQWERTGLTTAALPSVEWWKAYTKTGFASQLQVSMNDGRSFIPSSGGPSSSTAQVFAMPAPGHLLSLFPGVGMVSGGTQVAIAGDFFQFDTQDAAVSLQWRESRVTVPAACLTPEGSTAIETDESDLSGAAERRVVFRTPPLPFPNDTTTAAAMAEGMVLGTREEVEVFVALDGVHFADSGLRFVYCAVPEVHGISPEEAEPGTKMVLSVQKVVATPSACVRLTAANSQVSLVVPVDIAEGSHTAEFVLPELPLGTDEKVLVALSLNGQEFMEGNATSGAASATDSGGISFRYKVPPSEINGGT